MLKSIVAHNKKKRCAVESTIVTTDSSDERESEVHEEYQYLNLLSDILVHGNEVKGRNGITKSVFGAAMHFSLKDGTIPILTTKKTA